MVLLNVTSLTRRWTVFIFFALVLLCLAWLGWLYIRNDTAAETHMYYSFPVNNTDPTRFLVPTESQTTKTAAAANESTKPSVAIKPTHFLVPINNETTTAAVEVAGNESMKPSLAISNNIRQSKVMPAYDISLKQWYLKADNVYRMTHMKNPELNAMYRRMPPKDKYDLSFPAFLVDFFVNHKGQLLVLLSWLQRRSVFEKASISAAEWTLTNVATNVPYLTPRNIDIRVGSHSLVVLLTFEPQTPPTVDDSFTLEREFWFPDAKAGSLLHWTYKNLVPNPPMFHHVEDKSYLTLSTMVDARHFRRYWLEPWLYWHRKLGVERFIFYLAHDQYTFPSQQKTKYLNEDWKTAPGNIDLKLDIFDNPTNPEYWANVTVIPFDLPVNGSILYLFGFGFQLAQRFHSIQHAKGAFSWIGQLDVDEYFSPPVHDSLVPVLARYENDPAYHCYGARHVFFTNKIATPGQGGKVNGRETCTRSVLDCTGKGTPFTGMQRMKFFANVDRARIMDIHHCGSLQTKILDIDTELQVNHYKENCTYYEPGEVFTFDDSYKRFIDCNIFSH